MAERFVRIRPQKDAPGTYLTLGIAFTYGRWFRVPDQIVFDGKTVDIIQRLKDLRTDSAHAVFDVCDDEAAAQAISEAEAMALLALTAPQRLTDATYAVTPAVTVPEAPPAPPEPAGDVPDAKTAKGKAKSKGDTE